jgi:hypothetical protein
MTDKITRRRLAAAALGSAAALGPAAALRAAGTQAPAPAAPQDLTAAAKEQVHKYSETLAKFDLPMSTEPAFQFKA